ncbi:MAG: DUF2834 domain-containing protein [Deltaproteobacteria bacterium]|nr:DUF2834 domain-containing protein [Deltaproteobacteria bacterium]
MTLRTLALLAVLIAFSGFTALLVVEHGYLGFFEILLSTGVGVQVFIDLVIALTLILGWMRIDARGRALPFVPWALTTLVLGSIGVLGYLLHRELAGARASVRRA